jgi:hypothetical protein
VETRKGANQNVPGKRWPAFQRHCYFAAKVSVVEETKISKSAAIAIARILDGARQDETAALFDQQALSN